jgi:hypothetical protein
VNPHLSFFSSSFFLFLLFYSFSFFVEATAHFNTDFSRSIFFLSVCTSGGYPFSIGINL